VHAGRISDRFGVLPDTRQRNHGALARLVFLPSLNALYFSAALLGLRHIFHVSVHNLVGSLGAADRTKNFAVSLALDLPSSGLARRLQHQCGLSPALRLAASAALPALAMLARPPSASGQESTAPSTCSRSERGARSS
jgi:hypothetical protein